MLERGHFGAAISFDLRGQTIGAAREIKQRTVLPPCKLYLSLIIVRQRIQ